MFSIDGIASGLDTAGMIRSLLQVERLPVQKLEQQQASLRKVDDAWGQITTRLSSLRTAISDLTKGTSFVDRWKTASSNEAAAAASVTGTPKAGSTTFTVDQLATAQAASTLGDADANGTPDFTSGDQLVGGGSTFRLIAGDGTTELVAITTDATTTLSDLAAQIDAADGVSASVVRAGTGDYRLVISSDATGEAGNFTIASDVANLATADFNVTAGVNAQLTIGNLQIERASNTVTDLIDGVSIALKATGTTTVTTTQDVDGAAASVKKLVDEVNATLTKLKELTSYDVETKRAGALQGDPTARRMVDQLRRGVMDVVSGITGNHTTAGSVGISMNRDGGFTLDQVKLKAALTEDPAAVDRLFSRSGSSAAAGISFGSSTSATRAGDYEVIVSQAASVARLTGASYTSPATDPQTFSITARDGTVVEVTVGVGDNAAAAVQKINAALAAANVGTIEAAVVTLADNSEAIELAETRYGSAHGFTVGANTLGLAEGPVAGTNVVGTIDGQTATGSGNRLSLAASSDSPAAGLSVNVDAGVGAASGSVTVGTGIVGRLDQLLVTYEGSTGAVQSARKSVAGRIDLYQDRIDAFELRIASREITLRRQFTAMEIALAQLQDQGNWLASQLGSLNQQSG